MDSSVVFDRPTVRRRRDRAAESFADYAFLFQETGRRLAERLSETTRLFPIALDLGCHDGLMTGLIRGQNGVETVIGCDLSPAMARQAARNGAVALAADEEALPFAPESVDLVVANLSLHWVNDLPGTLLQIRHVLKEDGLFLACLPGLGTLDELRGCLMEAESIEEGGVSPRVSPFVDIQTMGRLLQRAGFALPMVDADTIAVTYADSIRLLADLRGMGETNSVALRRKSFTRKATLARALSLYQQRFAGPDGRIRASVQILTLTAWRPHASQPKPLPPGSGKIDLGTALDEA